jgi:hypothetical protein
MFSSSKISRKESGPVTIAIPGTGNEGKTRTKSGAKIDLFIKSG